MTLLNGFIQWRSYLPSQAKLLTWLPVAVLTLCGLGFALLTVLAVVPAVQARSERLAQLPAARRAQAAAEATQAALPRQLQSSIEAAERRRESAAGYFLSEVAAGKALDALYQHASASGVTIIELQNQTNLPSLDEAATPAPYTLRTLGLRATGKMEGLISFVGRIQESKRSGFILTNLQIKAASNPSAPAASSARPTNGNNRTPVATPTPATAADAAAYIATMTINLYTSEYAPGATLGFTATVTTTLPGLATPVGTPATPPANGTATDSTTSLFPLPTFTPGGQPTPVLTLIPLATPVPTLLQPTPSVTAPPTATPMGLPSPTATGLPTVAPTATTVPTIAPTVPTVAPTATSGSTPPGPTAVPTASGCTNLLANSDFESIGGWMLGETALQPQWSGNQWQSGLRSMQLGNPPGAFGPYTNSYSSIQQLVTIPADAATVVLRWWRFDGSNEGNNGAPSPGEDRQEVLLLAPNGDVLALVERVRRTAVGWQAGVVDLSAFRGQSVIVYLNVYNDGNGASTWSYVDDVRLEVCTGAATPLPPTATPVPPTGVPPTATPTLTPLPTATSLPAATATATPIPTDPPTLTATPLATDPPTPTPTVTPPLVESPTPTATTSLIPLPPNFDNCQTAPPPGSGVEYPVKIVAVDKSEEIVYLQNLSVDIIDLTGWHMCSLLGAQEHTPLGGTIAPSALVAFDYGGPGNIWNNEDRDDGALYNASGQLVSYWVDPN